MKTKLFLISLLASKIFIGQTVELLSNQSFEGSSSWVEGSDWHIGAPAGACFGSGDSYAYFSLPSGAYICNNGAQSAMYQQFTVPENATMATVSVYMNISTSETNNTVAWDEMFIDLVDTSDDPLVPLGSVSNMDGNYNSSSTCCNCSSDELCLCASNPCPNIWLFEEEVDLSEYQGETIRLRFSAETDGGLGTIFRLDDASVLANLEPCAAPAVPTGFTVDAATSSSIDLDWISSSGADYYEVYTCSGSIVDEVSSSSYTVEGLNDCTSYQYKVRACKDCGECSPFTSCITGETDCCTAPNAPSGLNASSPTQTTINLSWSTIADAELYEVHYNLSGCGSSMTLLGEYAATSTSVSGLDCETTYYFKVRAVKECDDGSVYSAYSSCDFETTLGCTSECSNPVEITNDPENVLVTEGGDATFTCSFAGTPPFEYTWYNIFGFTMEGPTVTSSYSCSLVLEDVSTSIDGVAFYCVVTNCDGDNEATSGNATLSVDEISTDLEFDLNPVLSHLFWPFSESNWSDDVNDPIRDGWRGGQETVGYGGNGWNQGGHTGYDLYADDWNRNAGSDDCNRDFLSPLAGTVIEVFSDCPTELCYNNPCSEGPTRNRVAIRSSLDMSYVFMVIHLNATSVFEGEEVEPGDLIGTVGATGVATSYSHAHCVLYRNVDQPYLGGTLTPLDILDFEMGENPPHWLSLSAANPGYHAVPFIFDAVADGSGGAPDDTYDITANGNGVLCPGESISLSAPSGFTYLWNNGETTQTIEVTSPGTYYVELTDEFGITYFSGEFNVVDGSILLLDVITDEQVFLCDGTPLEIFPQSFPPSDEGGINQDFSFSWSTGETTNSILVQYVGQYTVEISSNSADCANSVVDTIQVLAGTAPGQPVISINAGVELACSSNPDNLYQWYFFGEPIEGATSQFLTATASGYYTVEIANVYGCTSLSEPVYITDVSESASSIHLKVYPNPNGGSFMVDIRTGRIESSKIEIFNPHGEELYCRNVMTPLTGYKKEINLEGVASGLYLVRVTTEHGTTTKRILIE